MTKIRSIFDKSEKVVVDCRRYDAKLGKMVFDPGLTKQADRDACDINLILARYEKTGVLPDMIRQDARYGDFSNVPTYQEAMEVVFRSQEQFGALSARVRERFHNDPAEMLAFCSDPKNAAEMVQLGLAVPQTPSAQPAVSPEPGNTGAKGSTAPSGSGASGVPTK